MLGVVGDGANVLVAAGKIHALEAVGMRERAARAQLVPNRIGVLDPARVEVIEIAFPIVDRRPGAHQSCSSITSMAGSGQFAPASQAVASSPAGTPPPPTSPALRNSARATGSRARP